MHGVHGWAAVAAVVTIIDVHAIRTGHPERTMSAVCDRARAHHPAANAIILCGIAVVAGHLARVTPRGLDPFRLIGLGR